MIKDLVEAVEDLFGEEIWKHLPGSQKIDNFCGKGDGFKLTVAILLGDA